MASLTSTVLSRIWKILLRRPTLLTAGSAFDNVHECEGFAFICNNFAAGRIVIRAMFPQWQEDIDSMQNPR